MIASVLFSATIFLSSALLFLIQPLVAKMVLPLAGGSPAVWNTCMMFFQTSLLIGYLYTHASSRWLGFRTQVWTHLALLLLPLLVLPVAISSVEVGPLGKSPILWLLALLGATVGLPALAVSGNAPMLQRWFATTSNSARQNPYVLYVSSNVASLLALVAYPILIEPTLTLRQQAYTWQVAYWLLVVFFFLCAALTKTGGASAATGSTSVAAGPDTVVTLSQRLRWFVLAFVPSGILLGVTHFLTTDIAAVPLLWVVPLALYLATFALAFYRPATMMELADSAFPILFVPLGLVMMLGATRPLAFAMSLHLAAFFAAALMCHSRLAADRPDVKHLTEYYFWIALGGMAGSVFNTLLAPLLFKSVLEYPLELLMACFLRPMPRKTTDRGFSWKDIAYPVALAAITLVTLAAAKTNNWSARTLLLVLIPVSFGCLTFSRRPLRFAVGLALVVIAGRSLAQSGEKQLYAERTFFGVYRVSETANRAFHELHHGTTLHGRQSLAPGHEREPLTYFHRTGPIGQAIAGWPSHANPKLEVGVVGLGAGSLSAYAQPGQHWTFFEIDPGIECIARDVRNFTYLRDCAGDWNVKIGDGRLSIAEAAPSSFDLLILDAFSSDSIPMHMLTREAVELYRSRVKESGLIAIHCSNRFLALKPVLSRLAAGAGLTAMAQDNAPTDAENDAGKTASEWVVMARRPETLQFLASDARWFELEPDPKAPLWTDDFSNVWSVLR